MKGFSAELPAGDLLALMRNGSRCASSKSPIPIFGHALLALKDGRLSASSMDGDRSVASTIEAEGDGATTVEAERMVSILQSLDLKGSVSLKAVNGHSLELKQGRAKFAIPTLRPDDFPDIAPSVGDGFEIPAKELAAALKSISPAMAAGKDARFYLKGVRFDRLNGRVVATDGKVLGYSKLLPIGKSAESFTLPDTSAETLVDLCRGAETVRVIYQDGDAIASFVTGDTTFRTKVLDVEFPDYPRALPKAWKVVGRVNADDFMTSLIRAENTTKYFEGTCVTLEFGEHEISASSSDVHGGQAADVCEWDRTAGVTATLKASSRYVRWAVSSLDAKILQIAIAEDTSAVVITDVDDVEGIEYRLFMERFE